MKAPSHNATPLFAPPRPITISATSQKNPPISWLNTDINEVAILRGCDQLKNSASGRVKT